MALDDLRVLVEAAVSRIFFSFPFSPPKAGDFDLDFERDFFFLLLDFLDFFDFLDFKEDEETLAMAG